MKIQARGLRRDVGWNLIGDQDLNCGFMDGGNGDTIQITWSNYLRLGGDYWVRTEVTPSDVVEMFKQMFGSELDINLLDKHGFTISDDLKSRALRTLKLENITLGDLAALQRNTEAPAIEAPPTKRLGFRRV
jgi:hypothetical protein